jgi:glycerol uptake facilitator-like aquaporin
MKRCVTWTQCLQPLLSQAFAEFIGTFVLVVIYSTFNLPRRLINIFVLNHECQLIGNGSIAQSILSHKEKGDFFSINWGWAMGVTFGLLISANISGNFPHSFPHPIILAIDKPFHQLNVINLN